MTEQTLENKLFDNKVPLVDTIQPNDWMTPKEVADVFGVKPRTVNRWLAVGNNLFSKVKCYKTLGGHRRFYRPDVLEALEAHENQQNDKP